MSVQKYSLQVDLDSRGVKRGGREAEDAMDRLRRKAGGATDATSGLSGAMGKLRTVAFAAAGALAAFGLGKLIRDLISTARTFQDLGVQLQTVTGSAVSAQKALDFIADFAKTTPFEVENITRAFVRLKASGIEPTRDLMLSLGDTAAAFGRDITDFTGAVVSAAFGETERLKQFGILAKAEGDKLRVTFKGMTTEIDRNVQSVVDHMQKLGEQEFAGGMERQAKTLSGVISNLQDAIGLFARKFGEAGVIEAATQFVQKMIAAVDSGDDFATMLGETVASAIRVVSGLLEFVIKHFDTLKSVVAGLIAMKLVPWILGVNAAWKSGLVVLGYVLESVRAIRAGYGGLVALNVAQWASSLINPFTLVAATIGLVVASMVKLHSAQKRYQKEVLEPLNDAMRRSNDLLLENIQIRSRMGVEEQIEVAKTDIENLEQALDRAREALEKSSGGFKRSPGMLIDSGAMQQLDEAAASAADRHRQKIDDLSEALRNQRATLADLEEQKEMGVEMDRLGQEEIQRLNDEERRREEALAASAESQEALNKALEDSRNKLRAYQIGLRELQRGVPVERVELLVEALEQFPGRDATDASIQALVDMGLELQRTQEQLELPKTLEEMAETVEKDLRKSWKEWIEDIRKAGRELKKIKPGVAAEAMRLIGEASLFVNQEQAITAEIVERLNSMLVDTEISMAQIVELAEQLGVHWDGLRGTFIPVGELTKMQELSRGADIVGSAISGLGGKWADFGSGLKQAVGGMQQLKDETNATAKAFGAANLIKGVTAVAGALGLTADANYAAEGQAVGAVIGAVLAAVFSWGIGTSGGAAIGGAAGGAIGSFVNRGPDTGIVETFDTADHMAKPILAQVQKADKILKGAMDDVAKAIESFFKNFELLIDGSIETMGRVIIKQRGDEINVFANGVKQVFTDMASAMDFAITEMVRTGSFSGISETMKRVLQAEVASVDELMANIDFGKQVEEMGLDEAAIAIKRQMEDFRGSIRKAMELDLSASDLLKIADHFAQGVQQTRDSILGIQETEEERIRRQSEAFNAQLQLQRAELLMMKADLEARAASLEGQAEITGGMGDLIDSELRMRGAWLFAQAEIVEAEAEVIQTEAKLAEVHSEITGARAQIYGTEMMLEQERLEAQGQILQGQAAITQGTMTLADSIAAALAAVDQILADLPGLISEGEIADAIRRARGGGGRRRQARENLVESLEDIIAESLPEFVGQIRDLNKWFAETSKEAERLGVDMNLVAQAMAEQRRQIAQDIMGRAEGLAGLASDPAFQLDQIITEFDELAEALRKLDSMQNTEGGGSAFDEELARLDELREKAIGNFRDQIIAQLTGGSEFSRQVDLMNQNLEILRENAELFGLTVQDVADIEERARQRLLDSLMSQLGDFLPEVELRQRFDAVQQIFDDLEQNMHELGLSAFEVVEIQRRVAERMAFDLIDRLNEYVQNEQVARQLAQARWEMEIANMHLQFRLLKDLNLLSQETIDLIEGLFLELPEEAPEGFGGFRGTRTTSGGGGGSTGNIERERWQLRQRLQDFLRVGMGPFQREIVTLRDEFATLSSEAARLGIAQSEVSAAMKAMEEDLRKRILEPLQEFVKATFYGGGAAGGTVEEQFAAAQQEFADLIQAALSGDIDAIGELPGVADLLLGLAGQMFGSGADFQAIWDMILAQLEAVEEGLDIDLTGGTADPTWQDEMIQGIHQVRDAIDEQDPWISGSWERLKAVRDRVAELSEDGNFSMADLYDVVQGLGGMDGVDLGDLRNKIAEITEDGTVSLKEMFDLMRTPGGRALADLVDSGLVTWDDILGVLDLIEGNTEMQNVSLPSGSDPVLSLLEGIFDQTWGIREHAGLKGWMHSHSTDQTAILKDIRTAVQGAGMTSASGMQLSAFAGESESSSTTNQTVRELKESNAKLQAIVNSLAKGQSAIHGKLEEVRVENRRTADETEDIRRNLEAS